MMKFTPKPHQNKAIDLVFNSEYGLNNFDRTQLIMACGTGKTFTSLQIAQKLAMNGNRTILIGNISFFTGIDLPNELINTLIIGKLPFEPNHFLKKRTDTDNNYGSVINNRNKAIITFRQGIGRGLRNNHDKVFIAVCDPRIYDKKNASFLYFIESMSVPHKMQKKKW